jgi:hypothetical protein
MAPIILANDRLSQREKAYFCLQDDRRPTIMPPLRRPDGGLPAPPADPPRIRF